MVETMQKADVKSFNKPTEVRTFDKGKVELDLTLEPGDLILVPERLVRF